MSSRSLNEKVVDSIPTRVFLEYKWWSNRVLDRKKFKKFQKRRRQDSSNNYSYKPFDEKKAIFLHVPKCAGVSVSRAIFGNLSGGHKTLDHYLEVFEPRLVLEYFKFTIVRNPWDRLVSAYFFLERGGFDDDDRRWFEDELRVYSDFEDFVVNWLNEDNIWKWDHFRPQCHYIFDRNRKVKLDFIGRFEHLDHDFQHIVRRLNVSGQLPRFNAGSRNRDYRIYFTKQMKNIVADVYAQDIDTLGYVF